MFGHHIDYSYDASGMKHRAVYYTVRGNLNVPLGTYMFSSPEAPTILITDYCNNGHIIYENYSLKRILNPEGYAEKLSNGTYRYSYYAKDHLGNNRAVFISGAPTMFSPQQEISYYPFGLPHGAVYQPSDGICPEYQPYKFGGKEYDEMYGLNWHDFGARYYNGIVPMFMTMDPLAEVFPEVSLYSAFANNPIRFTDPTGMAPGDPDEPIELPEVTITPSQVIKQGNQVLPEQSWWHFFLGQRTYTPPYPALGQWGTQPVFIVGNDGKVISEKFPDKFIIKGVINPPSTSPVNVLNLIKSVKDLKTLKVLVKSLSKPGSKIAKDELDALKVAVEKFGGKIRVDMNGVKGTGTVPHAHVEGLGSSIESRHLWLDVIVE